MSKAQSIKLNDYLNCRTWNRLQLSLPDALCTRIVRRVVFANKGLPISGIIADRLDPQYAFNNIRPR